MKILIFGTGKAYRENKDRLDGTDKVIAFLDNDRKKQGKYLDRIAIYPPEKVKALDYEKIVIMSDYAVKMREQLLALGCSADSFVHYRDYFSKSAEVTAPLDFVGEDIKKSCLVITSKLGYHGGAMVAVYAAEEMMRRGYKVVIAAPDGDAWFIEEFRKMGVMFWVNQDLPYLKWRQLSWVTAFQKIIVNTYPMILCALEIGRQRPVSVWLHESENMYPTMNYWLDCIRKGVFNNNIKLCAVSSNARQNFINNVADCDMEIMPYGIPDIGHSELGQGEKLRFAIIGSIHPIKRQLFFLQTLAEMEEEKIVTAEFFIIGRAEDGEYAESVCLMAETMEQVQIMGELQRKEMDAIYRRIDVVVVPSMYEALSIVATEAMMNGKICIVSNSTGNAKYIVTGKNGFVFRNGDQNDLAEKINWCIGHRDRLQRIGKNARKVYETNFTLEKMGDRLERLP